MPSHAAERKLHTEGAVTAMTAMRAHYEWPRKDGSRMVRAVKVRVETR